MEVPLEKYLDWPPFYTLQLNSDVRTQQMNIWATVILDFARKNKLYIATAEDFSPITNSSRISRSLNQNFLQELFKSMEKTQQVTKQGESMLMFWKSPGAWGETVHQWAVNAGRIGSVETIEGLATGDETVGEEFYEVPVAFLHEVLKALQKSHKCELFEVAGSWAVKFFN